MAGWSTIAKWEFFRSKQKFDKKTLMLLVIFISLLIAAAFVVAQTNLNMNNDIYHVAVTDPYLIPIIETDQRFNCITVNRSTAQNLNIIDIDLVIIDQKVYSSDTEKSASASEALEKTLKKYREAVLLSYNDINNTHPVWLTIHYLERQEEFHLMENEQDKTGTEQSIPEKPQTTNINQQDIESYTQEAAELLNKEPSNILPVNKEQVQQISKNNLLQKQTVSTPSNFAPPIPFTAVMYSFLFLFPIYFVSQFYSNSIMDERTNRKCELVLVAPLRSVDIVVGKTLPYIFACMMILSIITIYTKGLPTSMDVIKSSLLILAVLFPIVLLFFAVSFFCAILSRSFKELTFGMVFISVVVSGYLFFPAMFANVHAISLISPMTLIVNLIEGDTIKIGEYLFSTFTFYLVAISVFGFGTFIFREEDLFTQKPITEKMLDCIEMYLLHPYGSVFILSIILIPYVYMAQLMLIVMLFNLPLPYSILIMIFLSAMVEELVKSIGIFTLIKRKMVSTTLRNAAVFAILAGAGFFIGEKLLIIITLAPIGASVFGLVMSMGTLLLIPLIIHITCAMIVSCGMYYTSTRWYLPFLGLATLLHGLYNIYLLRGIIFD